MAIVTATQVAAFTDISTGATAIAATGLIPIVQERINLITNNYFTSDMALQGPFTFASASTSITSGSNFEDKGFLADDEVYIYNSYRNDGYKTISSVSDESIILSSADTVIAEPSGRSILISVVQWPASLAYIAAQMVKYDYDDRPAQEANVKAKSLGPYSVTYGQAGSSPFGYPEELVAGLAPFTIARLN